MWTLVESFITPKTLFIALLLAIVLEIGGISLAVTSSIGWGIALMCIGLLPAGVLYLGWKKGYGFMDVLQALQAARSQ